MSVRRLKGEGDICDLRTWYRIYRSRRPLEQLLAKGRCNGLNARRTLCAFGHLVGVGDVI